MPAMTIQEKHAIIHHTLGNGEFNQFMAMAAPVVCAKTMLTPENCVNGVEHVITATLEQHPGIQLQTS
jgi:indolepyruvate decarboxylase